MPKLLYCKENKFIYVDDNNKFTYERHIFISFDNFFISADYKRFQSDSEISNLVEYFKVDKHIEIVSALISAPLEWLKENNFYLYIKPEKKKRKYTKKITNG